MSYTSTRLPWVDTARALAVVLVVMFHVLIWMHPMLLSGSYSGFGGVWDESRLLLGRLRMPLLMVLSGYLVRGALARGWGAVRLRFVSNLWLYLVWTIVFFLTTAGVVLLTGERGLNGGIETWGHLAVNTVLPETILWYIFAMAVYPVVLAAAKSARIPVWLIFVVGLVLWAYSLKGDLPFGYEKLAGNFIYFTAGVHGHLVVNKLQGTGVASGAVALVAFVVAAHVFPTILPDLGKLAATAVGVSGVVMLLSSLVSQGPISRAVGQVGKRTVEIYVLQWPIMQGLYVVYRQFDWQPVLSTKFGDASFVLGNTVLITAIALLLGALLRKLPGVLTFPESWKAAFLRRAKPAE